MLLSRDAADKITKILVPEDFYKPAHALIYDAISHLYAIGESVDPVTVSTELKDRDCLAAAGGSNYLMELMANTPATSSAGKYASIIAGRSTLRKIIAASTNTLMEAYAPGADAQALIEQAQINLAEAVAGITMDDPDGLYIMDEFLDRPLEERPPWVIPGLLRRQWRAMVVAGEGSGKTVLFRQVGIAAAQGIHPLHFAPIDPCRVLIVDLENPEDSIHEVCQPIRAQSAIVSTRYDSERAWLWHRPGGIDLRNRRDRMELETVIAKVRPDLVCLGPIYKSYNIKASESDELVVKEVMQVFDDLRTRYDFALLLEHHAAKGTAKNRDLKPYGSSLWLRWPELGLKLTPTESDGHTMQVGRWRGDRLENSWPTEIRRSKPWLWEGVWPAGTFTDPASPPVPTKPNLPSLPPPGVDPETGEIRSPHDYDGDEPPF